VIVSSFKFSGSWIVKSPEFGFGKREIVTEPEIG
jgi:hypothetical protein